MENDTVRAVDFVGILYKGCTDGLIEIRTLPNAHQYWIESSDKLDELLPSLSTNVHFGVGLRSTRSGKADAVSCVTAIWADFDGKDFDGGMIEAAHCIASLELKATIIVNSGNGFHCYWKLRKPIVGEGLVDLPGHVRGWAAHIGADKGASDLARMLRLPGTWNYKDEANPKQVYVSRYYPQHIYSYDDFKDFWVEPSHKYAVNIQRVRAKESVPDKFSEALASDSVLRNLWDGTRSGADTSRSGMDMALACRLVRHGYTHDEIATVLMNYNYGKAPSEQPRYLDFTVSRAFGFVQGSNKTV